MDSVSPKVATKPGPVWLSLVVFCVSATDFDSQIIELLTYLKWLIE
jgi:hypothetical protein